MSLTLPFSQKPLDIIREQIIIQNAKKVAYYEKLMNDFEIIGIFTHIPYYSAFITKKIKLTFITNYFYFKLKHSDKKKAL